MSKMSSISVIIASVVLLFVITVSLLSSTSQVEAHSSRKDKSPTERAIEWKSRLIMKDRLRRAKNLPELQNLDSLKESFGCLECQIGVGSLVKTLTSATGVNLTLDFIKKDICEKKFANKTTEITLCVDAAKILIHIISEAFSKATDGGWNVAEDICADVLHKCLADCCSTPYVPEQIAIAFADNNVLSDSMSMRISWMTLNKTTGDFISYKDPSTSTWTNLSSDKISQENSIPDEAWSFFGQFHSGVITNLKPNTNYSYYVGSSNGQYKSATFTFKTLPLNVGTEARPLRIAAIADIGTKNSQDTINAITAKAKTGEVDFCLLTGDIGYSDMSLERFATFAKMIEPFASMIPVMTVPGNHEANFLFNFSQYRHRYIMPSAGSTAPSDAMFYTFTIGPVNFFQLNTETFIDTANIDQTQVNWMRPLMAKANSAPGTFSMINQHRPLYCSSPSKACFNGDESNYLRIIAEYIYYENHIDFVYAGHVHNLNTMNPIREGKPAGSYAANATEIKFPTAPMFMVGGNAGQQESLQTFKGSPAQPWDRVRAAVIGYQTFEFVQKKYPEDSNKLHTSLKVTAIQSNNSKVLDEFTLISSR